MRRMHRICAYIVVNEGEKRVCCLDTRVFFFSREERLKGGAGRRAVHRLSARAGVVGADRLGLGGGVALRTLGEPVADDVERVAIDRRLVERQRAGALEERGRDRLDLLPMPRPVVFKLLLVLVVVAVGYTSKPC